jgi:hypothetical protein
MNTNTNETRVIEWIEAQDEINLAVEIYISEVVNNIGNDTDVNFKAMLEYIGLVRDETPDGLLYWSSNYDVDVLDSWLESKFQEFVKSL